MQNSDYYGEDEDSLIEDKYRFDETSAEGCIRRILNASSHNKMSYVIDTVTYDNGYELDFVTFYIYTSDVGTIVKCFNDASFKYIISNSTDYPYVKIIEEEIEVDPDIDIEEGETVEYGLHQLNKEQYKIAIWLEKKYATSGLTQPVIAYWVANNYWDADYTKGQYITKVERDSDGNITNVELDLATIQVPGLDVSDEAFETIVNEQKDERPLANPGGILLSPIFYLINFVADAVISVTGSVMYPSEQGLDFGLGILTNTMPDNRYENTIEKDVDTTSFLPTNFSGIFSEDGSAKYQYPHINYTPEEIFAGKVDLLNIDFVTGKGYDGKTVENSSWINIRKVISQWYQVLRMIAIIGLLSVLIYTGIKILISANAKDKAKYKEWIINWLMAVGILFFMHYIMAFIVSVIGEFSNLMTEASAGITVKPSDDPANAFQTNLMGLVRFMIQSENFYIKVAYEVMYIALITYTLKFTMTYLKRVLNMAFLTLIAPIVALTYPIDKISDGTAQGFDMWLKEYIFNALLQPMHCILYYVFVGSAIEIAATNPIYGIVVLAFMSQAENLLKKIFGFGKAGGGTVGGMSNAFAAGAIASKIAKMAKMSKGITGKIGDGGTNDDLYKNLKPTEKDSDKDNALFDDSPDKEKNTLDSGNKEDGKEDKDKPTPNNGQNTGQNRGQNRGQSTTPQVRNSSNNASATPVRSMAGRVGRGAMAVGKRLAKPIWDFDHGGKYNGKRLIRKAGRATLGASLGVAAAAVQAGISITDGKYNPMEGMASFAASYAGAGQIAKGMRSLGETYKQGTLPDDPNARKKVIMERAQKEWTDREDVIKHNKNKYSSNDRDSVINIQKQLLAQGVTDVKEMDDCIKYAKSLNNGSLDGVSPDQVRRARVMHDCSKDSTMQKVAYDPSKKKGYIDSVAKDDREKRILENQLNELIKYNDIVNKK